MPDYQVFGGILHSQLTFPELVPAAALPPRWVLAEPAQAVAVSNAVLLGREQVEPGVEVTLSRHDAGLRLAFDDTGIFDISVDGCRIDWTRPADPNLPSVRKDVLGRILAVCLHQQGVVTLHGSAVELAGVAIAFLAPKFHGKSTTAAALVNAGARFLTDDVVAVTPGPAPAVLPGVPIVQLWEDSAARVALEAAALPADEGAPKVQRRWDAVTQQARASAPLAAVYLLAPVPPGAPGGVQRTRLTGVEAALALLGQSKIGNLLGVERRAHLLQAAGELADRVPVYRLGVPRDFGQLPELTRSLREWHDPGAARTSAAKPA